MNTSMITSMDKSKDTSNEYEYAVLVWVMSMGRIISMRTSMCDVEEYE